ncbi:MAG: DUF1993 domain-containing protein [Sphingopyxis sp.]|nr:DUF1993 domain-containing protein [Sphingopyxis sp.]
MIHAQTIPIFEQQVRALLGQLAKAAAWCADNDVAEADLLDTRLAPDMHPLAKQLDFVVAQLLQPMRRLAAREIADPPEAAPTITAHRDRLKAALRLITEIDADQLDSNPDRMIALDLPGGMAFDLPASAYVRDWALPQFWFHIMAAYTIMRMRGVPIGKADHVPYMMQYMRQA